LLRAKCGDFKTETTAMHQLPTVLGIGIKQTPKGNLELARRGVEYFPCKRKYKLRKYSNFISSRKKFEKRVMAALASVALNCSRAYLPKTSDYERAYRMLRALVKTNDQHLTRTKSLSLALKFIRPAW
jgi:hypothetical protein